MASSKKPGWPKVTSTHHQSRSCGPCFVDSKWQTHYDHFRVLTSEEQRFLQRHTGGGIPDDSCLCRAHRKEAQRHQYDPEYIPTWKKGEKENVTICMHCAYPECTATSMSERIIVPSDETQVMFRESLCTQQSVVLCEAHYQHLYRQLHMHHPCPGCGAKPKARQNAYTRHSPDAVTISQYLCE